MMLDRLDEARRAAQQLDVGHDGTFAGVAVIGRDGRWDIAVRSGRIETMRPSESVERGVIMPALADAHVHLDKTFTAARFANKPNTLLEAIEMIRAERATWTEDDIRQRAGRALESAYAHGVRAMRSHVDWEEPDEPLAWGVLNELKQEWRGRIELQLASLSPIDLIPEAGKAIADTVRASGGVLGAFVYRNEALEAKLDTMFRLAADRGLALDFHVDEALELEACGFEAIVERAHGFAMAGRVLCGHACSLSLRHDDEAARLLDSAAASGVGLVCLPTTNLYLQDNRPGRTPRLRGTAPIKEARERGVEVVLASDNCRDPFYPFGDYDPIDVFRTAIFTGQLVPADWTGAITTTAAPWCGCDWDGHLEPGSPADFIWFDADDLDDLVSRPRARRVVFRGGEAAASVV